MERKIILVLFLILTSVSYSQDTSITDKPTAVSSSSFHPNGKLKIKKYYNIVDYSKLESYREYYDNGQLRLLAKFKNSKLHNELTAYWKNGNLKRKDLYRKGILVEGKCWDPNGNEIEYTEFEIPSEMTEG